MKYRKALRVGKFIELHLSTGDGVLQCERILGGIIPAVGEMPYYACAFGQIPYANKEGKKKLVFLEEIENEMPNAFFDRVVKISRNFHCPKWIYNVTDWDENALDGLYQLLQEYRRKHNIMDVKLSQAQPLGWTTAITLIQQWVDDEGLDIPRGTILGTQLGKMGKADRHLSRRKNFYAVDALRAIISLATKEYRPGSGSPVQGGPTGFFYA